MLYSVAETAEKLDNLLNEDFFYFLRFGDGDLHLMIGHVKEQRHRNSPELRRELLESIMIKDSKYILSDTAGSYGDGSGSYFWIDSRQQQAFDNNLKAIRNRLRPAEKFYHALVFQYQIKHDPEWFISFCRKAFHGKKVLFIAGEPLCGKELVHKAFNVSEEIAFPGLSDAYYYLNKGMKKIVRAAENCDIIIPVIGMASRVLSKRLWNMGLKKSVIDIGVSVDALANATHRGWTKRFVKEGGLEPYKREFI